MSHLISLILMVLVFLDIHVLKRLCKEVFLKTFYRAGRFILILFFVLSALSFYSDKSWIEAGTFSFWVSFLAIYILRRSELTALVNEKILRGKESFEPLLRFSDSLGVLVLWFFIVIVFSFIINKMIFILRPFDSELGELVLTGFLSSITIFILIYRASKRFSDKGFFYNIGMLKPDNSFMKCYFFPAFAGIIFAGISSAIIVLRKIQPQTPLNDVLTAETSVLVILFFIFLAIFIAPFIEEVVFRGYFYKIIKNLKGKIFAFYFIAVVFGVLHMPQYWGDWFAIFMVFVLGFVLTGFRLWADTAFSSAIMHYFYNAGMIIFPVVILVFSNQAYLKYSLYYANYDFQTKENLLKESIDNFPNFSSAYNDLAKLYLEEGLNLEKALELINNALEFEPRNKAYLGTKKKILSLLDQNKPKGEIK